MDIRIIAATGLVLLAAPASAFDRSRLAADAPRACPQYGPGFAKVAGSDSCVKTSGRVRAEAGTARRRPERVEPTPVSGRLAVDVRTPTDYGPIRTFVRVGNGRR